MAFERSQVAMPTQNQFTASFLVGSIDCITMKNLIVNNFLLLI